MAKHGCTMGKSVIGDRKHRTAVVADLMKRSRIDISQASENEGLVDRRRVRPILLARHGDTLSNRAAPEFRVREMAGDVGRPAMARVVREGGARGLLVNRDGVARRARMRERSRQTMDPRTSQQKVFILFSCIG